MEQFGVFNNSQNVQAETIEIVTILPSGVAGPLQKLENQIAAAAIYDSPECCRDASKCHPETRVAVQAHLYSWIVDGDGESDQPKKITWVTGPAGTGKTAVMRSLSERCNEDGVLVATFFFASWSNSPGRRRKTALITTIVHQLARYHPDLQIEVAKAIDENSDVFDKSLRRQMQLLVLGPLQTIPRPVNRPGLRRGVIIIDGLDECEAEQYHLRAKAKSPPPRENSEDQQEILEVLQEMSSDPCFPFCLIIASRPERVFRSFFEPDPADDPAEPNLDNKNHSPFAHKLDLHATYNAGADITTFLEAQFDLLRRKFHLPLVWPPPGTIQKLVENASGQFIYAVTVIRALAAYKESPKDLLDVFLKIGEKVKSNPLKQLDVLYLHILESSPKPLHSVRWIRAINRIIGGKATIAAFDINMLLQTDPEDTEAELLLGTLHSLIQIPPYSHQKTTSYVFYHKSLFDFLEDSDRCGATLHIQHEEVLELLWDRFSRACTRGSDHYLYPESFLEFLASFPYLTDTTSDNPHPGTPQAGIDWWVSLAIARKQPESLWWIFWGVHKSVRAVLDLFQSFD